MLVMPVLCCSFFFRAEDGIRARTVTGVQTCALPISDDRLALGRGRADAAPLLRALGARNPLALLLRLRLRRSCGLGLGVRHRFGVGHRGLCLGGLGDFFGVLGLFSHYFPFADSRSFTTVRMRAISRFVSFSRALFSSAPVTDWKRRLNSSCRRSVSRCSSSSSVRSLSSLRLVKELGLPFHDLRLDGQLLDRELERVLRVRRGHRGRLELDRARL